jgi:hypothetical protein
MRLKVDPTEGGPDGGNPHTWGPASAGLDAIPAHTGRIELVEISGCAGAYRQESARGLVTGT